MRRLFDRVEQLKLQQAIRFCNRTRTDDHDREENEIEGRWDRCRDKKKIRERPIRIRTSSRLRRRAPVDLWRSKVSSSLAVESSTRAVLVVLNGRAGIMLMICEKQFTIRGLPKAQSRP